MIGTTPNCQMVGGHRPGSDAECAWCAGYTTQAGDGHHVHPATVQAMDNGEAGALAALNRMVAAYNEQEADGNGHTAIMLGLMVGLSSVYPRNDANDTLMGMVVTAVARIAQLEARNARR